jgi:hypothetical protein
MGAEGRTQTMTIKYSDGRSDQAVLLERTETTMRVAIQGTDHVAELTNIAGAWVSEDCDLVAIEFAWQRLDRKPTVSEADCCCSHELAAKLIHLLFTGSEEDSPGMIAATASQTAMAFYNMPV